MKRTLDVCILALVTVLIFSTIIQAQTTTVLVSKNVKGINWDPVIASDGNGHAVAVWALSNANYTVNHVYAAYLRIKGSKVKVAKAIRLSGAKSQNISPSIRYQKLSDSYLVAWEANGVNNYSIQTRELDAKGQPAGAEKECISGNFEQYFSPILCAIEGARKTKKSYIIVWYRIAAESSDTGLWSAVLNSKGEITKKQSMVLPAINQHHGGVQATPTWLTPMQGGGYLLGVSRVESEDNTVQRGLVVQLNKSGKKKKVAPLNAGDKITFITCESTLDESILVSWYRYTDGAVFNQVFDSSLNPIGSALRIYQDVCNGSQFIRVGTRLFQAFSVNYYGFFLAGFEENGSALGEPEFVDADQSLSAPFATAGDVGSGRIWFATARTIVAGANIGIYCIVYKVPKVE